MKKETLEEAAEKKFNYFKVKNPIVVLDSHIRPYKLGFLHGAKWQSEWISVNESLPESGENILMHHEIYGIGIGYYTPLDEHWGGTFHGVPVIVSNNKITHWMKLPSKPIYEDLVDAKKFKKQTNNQK